MDFFTKNKMLFWCVVILVLLNVATLTTFWMRRPPIPGPQGSGSNLNGQKLMEEHLGLSEQQAQKVQQIRSEHFARTRPLQDDMHKIRLDILNEIFAAEPDQTKIQSMLTELSDKQDQFEKYLLTHFEELKAVCDTQEQTDKLKRMLRDLIESTRPRDPGRSPLGPRGGMQPIRRPPLPQGR